MGGFALMMSKDGEAARNEVQKEVKAKTGKAQKKPEQRGDE
jgi:hypothetical protein